MVDLTRTQLLLELQQSQQQVVKLLESVAAVQDWQPKRRVEGYRARGWHTYQKDSSFLVGVPASCPIPLYPTFGLPAFCTYNVMLWLI